jgi:nucleoid-associated protein YgaU
MPFSRLSVDWNRTPMAYLSMGLMNETKERSVTRVSVSAFFELRLCRRMSVLGAKSMSLMVAAVAAVAAAGMAVLVSVNRPALQESPTASKMSENIKAPTTGSTASKPTSVAPVQQEAALSTAKQQANDLAALLAPPSPQSAARDSVPEFDIVHIKPTGEAVIAGRAAPGTTVELLRNGEPHDRVVVDQSGQFAMVPRPLPPGTYDLTLRSSQPDGKQATSKQSVAVVLEPTNDQPTVALMTPDKPTVVLSQPSAPASLAEAAVVEAVDIEPSGKLHVSGRARPGAVVRLYLNDSFVASATAGADGHLAVTINEGVAPGNYRVRLDELASNSGAVRTRAEVPFNVPDTVKTASILAQTAPSTPQEVAATQQPRLAAATSTVVPDKNSPSAVVVPKIATMTVVRGDSLWRLSSRTLGGGERYAVIYRANREQIRNPNLIYPGQVLVVPASERRR